MNGANSPALRKLDSPAGASVANAVNLWGSLGFACGAFLLATCGIWFIPEQHTDFDAMEMSVEVLFAREPTWILATVYLLPCAALCFGSMLLALHWPESATKAQQAAKTACKVLWFGILCVSGWIVLTL